MKIIKSNKKMIQITIGDIAKISSGSTPRKDNDDYWNSRDVPWMTSGEIHKKFLYDTENYISLNGWNAIGKKIFLEKTIMIALAGQGKTKGNVCFLEKKVSSNQSLAGIFVDSEKNDPLYIYYVLSSMYKEIRNIVGEGREGLNIQNIKNIKISIPDNIEYQKKVSNLLRDTENHIKKIKNLLEKIEIRNQYYADKLTSGHIKLNNSVSMNINKFETIINEHKKSKVMAGKSLKEGLYPFFNCSKKQTLFSNEYLIDDSVLLLSTGGTASVNYYNGKLSYSTDVWCITSKYTKYLYYFYNANINKIEQCFQGGGLKHLSKKDFKNIEITIPSNDKDIQEIVDYLDKLNDEKEKVEKLLQLEEQRFEWLSDKLLSGEYIIEN